MGPLGHCRGPILERTDANAPDTDWTDCCRNGADVRWVWTLSRNPIPISVTRREFLPKLTKGKVIPVTGISPTFIPMLTNDCVKSIAATPIASSWPKVSRALSAIKIP